MTVRMACGCAVAYDPAGESPRCETHAVTRVSRVLAPEPPRIRSVDCDATGPYVTKEQ
jgi:hypothetical protein